MIHPTAPRTTRIVGVAPGSPAAAAGLAVGDELLTINGVDVVDELGFRFLSAADRLDIRFQRPGGEVTQVLIEKDDEEPLGVELEPMKLMKCANRCIFCFVHQNPRGLRKSLYFKDEDYRYSFLYGHYVTLARTPDRDLQRIIDLRLSPIYISTHATDTDLRNRLLGIKDGRDVMEMLRRFQAAGIESHHQIVLCPGYNDGAQLERTVCDLASLYPSVRSVALVPVGLTRHRRNLPELRAPDRAYAREFIDAVEPLRDRCRRRLGVSFVYPADEWFIMAERPFPPAPYYEDFPQLINGVGLCRTTLDDFEAFMATDPRARRPLAGYVVTGRIAAPLVRRLVEGLNQLDQVDLEVVVAANTLFGPSIGVAGLLSGGCFLAALEGRPRRPQVFIPRSALADDRPIFLDDMTLDELAARLDMEVVPGDSSFDALFDAIEGIDEPAGEESEVVWVWEEA